MPFSAKHRETGERVFALDFTSSYEIANKFGKDVWRCPCEDCGRELYPRGGGSSCVSTHFAHKPNSPCVTRMLHHPESLEHLEGKSFVRAFLLSELGSNFKGSVHLEYPLKEVGNHGRIADVLIEFPMGGMVVHEVQLAAISPQELEARTNDYANNGIDCCWWLGGKARTTTNELWCKKNLGGSRWLEWEGDERSSNSRL